MRILTLAAVASLVTACAAPIDSGPPDAASQVEPDAGEACATGSKVCGGVCKSVAKDTANCGDCGVKCAAKQFCTDGKCTDTCDAPRAACGSQCVDRRTDHDNCGGCGKACAADQECQFENCIKACSNGLSVCGSECEDLSNDSQHCGGCLTVCDKNTTCMSGLCCGAGQTVCKGACTDTQWDNDNCGSCGFACGGSAPFCANGVCKSCNPTALVLMDKNPGDPTFISALTAAGIHNTYVKEGIVNYKGFPSAQNFGAIVLMSGSSFADMDPSGQKTILDAHDAGAGLVIDEWALYLKSLGYWTTLSGTFLVNYTTIGSNATHSLQVIQQHPIWNGLPSTWTLGFATTGVYGNAILNGGTKIASCTTCNGNQFAGVFVRDAQAGVGRRVQISLPFSYNSTTWSSDTNVVKLMVNSIRWATGCY